MNSKIVGSPDSAYANEEVGGIFSPGPDSIATIPLHEVSLHLDIESPFLAALPETEESPIPEENDGDIKQHWPESPPSISESSKGFREMSTGLKALNKSSLKKMKMKMKMGS
ncbi:hypothetical protein Dsin_023353 [Dipteronia sinensis]|uniref:Uncharacterized protein n=1 Tax=Dipteronia sinensis TaxID=43782 RepID=A0AAE0A3H0_9ROSI|nr:hypothetical protein Dsin_023353 [Dipteronia sinensis]